MEKILKSFLKRLTNISSNNRSVCLLKLYREQFFDLHRIDYLNKQNSFYFIGQLISGKKKLVLCDELDSRDEKVNEISKNIRKLSRREKLLFEETGAKDLYIGWPFVQGKFMDGSFVRCPLLFFPVSLLLENGKWILVQKEDSGISLNKNFLLAYSYFNKIAIPDEWIETSFDDFDKDPLAFRTALYEFLKASPIELNFNQDLFKDILASFKEYTSEAYNESHKLGEIKLFSEAVLGIFPQAGSYLVPDYENMIAKNEFFSFEDFLHSFTQTEEHLKIREENNYLIFKTDGSQEDALVKIKEGNSLVVQGPPGTGKSQLIGNLIADFTARGKKVLLVCQKKAALDVVYDRLKEKGVHLFASVVHDFRNDRAKIVEQLEKQISAVEQYKKENNGLDTIYLERTFTQSSRQIRQSQEELSSFHEALYSTKEFGISAKELYLTSNPHAPFIDLKEFSLRFTYENSLSFERKIKNILPYATKFSGQEYCWKDRKPFSNFYQRDLNSVLDVISKIVLYQKQLQISASKQLVSGLNFYPLTFFSDNKAAAKKITTLINDANDYYRLLELIKVKTDLNWITDRFEKIKGCFKNEQPEVTLSIEELSQCENYILEYKAAQKNIFSALYWKLFSGNYKRLSEIMASNGFKLSIEGAELLSKKIAVRRKLEKEKSTLIKKSWIKDFPSILDIHEIENWFEFYLNVLEAKDLFQASGELLDLVHHSKGEFKVFQKNFQIIPMIAEDIEMNYVQWLRYLTKDMIDEILVDESLVQTLSEVLRKDFDLLVEYDKLQEEFLAFESEIVRRLMADTQSVSEEDKIALFRNSIRLEWIGLLEEKSPILLSVTNLRMQQIDRLLQESISQKMEVAQDILQLKLRESTFKDIEYNRLQNRVTYRDLYHQVTKKKKHWPLRKLMNEFMDEMLALIPCWMVSPESASALFPLEKRFDLVIFDEASQCFSEQGLPAMYRGKQVVIAGDSKQLKPNDLYKARWEDESDDTPDLEIESLLDLATKYLPSAQLKGHYRSKNLELIDFSNKHFYNQSLQLIPNFDQINTKTPAISYVAVKGVWENNTNPIEAREVVLLALKLLAKGDGKSIGIVAFNFRQAQLITDLLEEISVEQKILVPENLFVKNIENVQGDERDCIIFSIGYAPDKNGKFSMHFGSLNQDGGENRLNVAITRAKEKIFLVASILPQQLSVEESIHEGPKLLKKYLEYSWQVSEGQYTPTLSITGNESKDWYLSEKILKLARKDAFVYSNELPFAEIVLKKNGNYSALIGTDDHLYYSNSNPKEMHAYKPSELREKGWSFKRLFSREFWLNQNSLEGYL